MAAAKSTNSISVAIIAPAPPPLGGMALQTQVPPQTLAKEGVHSHIVPTNAPLFAGLDKVPGVRAILTTLIYLWRLIRTLPKVSVVHIFAASYLYFYTRVVP